LVVRRYFSYLSLKEKTAIMRVVIKIKLKCSW
jgi:hypothetical protein